jgi:predicted O-methyltransferase YrrM
MKHGIKGFLKYKLFSRHRCGHGIHSPFVFELVTKVFRSRGNKKDIELANAIRQVMLSDKRIIKRAAFGANGIAEEIKAGRFVAQSSVTPKYGKLLYNLVAYYKPETILELGTAAGISAIYMALGNPNAKLVTVEGCRETAMIAQENFNRVGVKNATLVNAPFEEVLPLVFFDLKKIDMAFFDGNHTQDATLSYFERCLLYTYENSVFVFDDIHWSPDMEEAWEKIKQNDKVTVSVDLYRMGLVFFRSGIEKQHFIIRY